MIRVCNAFGNLFSCGSHSTLLDPMAPQLVAGWNSSCTSSIKQYSLACGTKSTNYMHNVLPSAQWLLPPHAGLHTHPIQRLLMHIMLLAPLLLLIK
jgi:hypothetical protein